jgi:protein ImuB
VPVQEHLTDRARPAPRDLAGTLARVEALVGPDRVGTPVLLDSHRPDPVRMEAFHMNLVRSPRPSSGSVTSLRPDALPSGPARRPALAAMAPETSSPESGPPGRPGLAVRRLRPPVPARVRLVGGRPVHLASARLGGAIVASAGPWRTSGEWWGDRPFLRDEWDVELADGTLCRLAHDGRGWALDAVYD